MQASVEYFPMFVRSGGMVVLTGGSFWSFKVIELINVLSQRYTLNVHPRDPHILEI
jgi:hypothetical protein